MNWPGKWTMGAVVLVMVPALLAQENPSSNRRDYTIPEGSEFKLQLHSTINSKTAKAGDRVLATLLDPVVVEDSEVLPKGLRLDGHVGEVQGARRRGRGGMLYIVFDTVELSSGEKVAILGTLTEIFASEGKDSDPNVGPEGEVKGKGASLKTRAIIVGGATAAGGAAGLGQGIGAGMAGFLVAVFLPKGKEAGISAGSIIGMRLDRDVTLSTTEPAR